MRGRILFLAAIAFVVGVMLTGSAAADVPPPTIDSSTPSSPANANSPSLLGTAEPLATVTLYTDNGCTVEAGASVQADESGNFAIQVSVPDDSSTTFYANATDVTGTSECSLGGFTYVEDSIPPSEPAIASHPDDPTTAQSATFTFTDSDPVAGYSCSLDGSNPTDCGSGSASYSGLADGQHSFSVTATDAAGNTSAPQTFIWTVDTMPPAEPAIQDAPANPSGSHNAAFSFSDSDPVAGYSCSLDGSNPTDCGSGSASYSGLADGQHSFSVTASDSAGNTSAPQTFSWTVDTTPPAQPTIQGAPTNPSGSPEATFTFTDGDEVASYRCQLDGGGFASCSSGVAFSGLLDGSHTFQVVARDELGHTSHPASYSWTIDTVHPLVTITDKPPLDTNQTGADFSFASDAGAAGYQCRLDGAAFASCTSPQHYGGLGDGSHTFSVRSVSIGGTPGLATSYTWTVDTVAPQTAIGSAPPAASTSRSATFTFTSSEPGSTFVCSLNSSGFTPCSSPQTYSGLGDGAYTFRVEALDAAGNADPTAAAYSWTISGVGPPTVDFQPPANVKKLRRNVGYGRMQLRWRKPPDKDFDHVGVYVSTSPRTPPRKLVYSGRSQSYTDRRFKNGQYYRYLVVSYDHAKNASGGTPALVRPSALLTSPRDATVVKTVPVFRWAAVPRATYYNIQLYSHGEKLLTTWPRKARQFLSRQWRYGGHSHSLRRGVYVWYVWPGFGARSQAHYGQLLGQGTFSVR
ncbi:MAG: large repetitive protein [Gaiellaceae bacterium]|nr:large repetitive protein [Gaiellaceae bacterium]